MTLRRSMIIGAWTLQTYVVVDEAGRQVTAPLGDDAAGHLLYTADGYMSAQLMRPRPTDAEPAAHAYLAYTGPFELDEATGTLYHHVDVSLRPEWVGGQQVREGALQDGVLTLSGDVSAEFGTAARAVLTWNRPGR